MSAYNHQIYTCFCEKSRAKLEWCAAIFPIAGEFFDFLHQTQWTISQRPLKTDLFIPNHTDWGWWLIGLTGHHRARQNQAAWSENSSPQYRWSQKRLKNLFASLEIVQNSHGKENHSNMFPPVIISFEVFLCDGLVVCHIPSAPGHAAAPCGGCGWLPSLKCLAVCSPCPCPCPQIPNHGSWNIMKWWHIYDLKFHSTWNQLRSHKCICIHYVHITYT